jgi:acyl-CoA thioesterase
MRARVQYSPRRMNSTHPDFVGLDIGAMSDAEALKVLNANLNDPVKILNGEAIELDSKRGFCRFRYKIVPAFCHSQGRICQGGFLTGMVDTAMAHAAMAKSNFACAVPTLELKISFLEAAGPGYVIAEGRVLRWGGSVGFLDGDIRDDKGRLVVHATSTIKIVRPRPQSS